MQGNFSHSYRAGPDVCASVGQRDRKLQTGGGIRLSKQIKLFTTLFQKKLGYCVQCKT